LGKKLRARSQVEAAVKGLPFAAMRWAHAAGIEDRDSILARATNNKSPAFCVHCHVGRKDSATAAVRALRSILEQSVAPVRIFVTQEAGTQGSFKADPRVTVLPTTGGSQMKGLLAALESAREIGAEWIVPLTAAGGLPRHALAAYGAHLLRQLEQEDRGAPVLLYGDEAEMSRFDPRPKLWLKPGWDPRMILSQDYVSWACALAVGPAQDAIDRCGAGGPHSLYELIVRLAEHPRIEHVPRITAFTPRNSWCRDGAAKVHAVRRVIGARAEAITAGPFGTVAVKFQLPERPPMVSVIVPTRDRVELLRTCVEGVLYATDYPAIELVIADNDSTDPETLSYMAEMSADPRVSVICWPHAFNYSAINNFAASHARGEFLCLLNNDIEVIEPHWLSALVREALQPGIGAVGARLLYPDRSIQHAGVVIGLGNAAGHAHRALPEDQPGYYAQAMIARGASAVTGACLLIARTHFEAVGGLDEDALAVAYNDVDLCLKLRELGLKNIHTPLATLIHHESKSRGLDFAKEHLERYMRELNIFQKRWNTKNVVDPWHHPKLDRASEVYRL
jgi:GT2 family glycosyltransferase